MNDRRDRLEVGFDSLRAERVPLEIEARLHARLFAVAPRAPHSRRRLALTAAALVVLGGLVGAAVARWWHVSVDTREQRVEGGTLKELQRDANGATHYEIELPDGRRVTVDVPPPAAGERRVEVELPAPRPLPTPESPEDERR